MLRLILKCRRLYIILYDIVCSFSSTLYDVLQSGDGETGLILACCKGQKSVAELLINRGANVHYQDKVSAGL